MSDRRALAALALLLAAAPLGGCGKDEALAPYVRAVDAWEEGRDALAAGRPADAADAFARARKADDRSSALGLWEAKALADAGRLPEADAVLSALVRSEPNLGAAWYNRAAYRVRAGRMEEAAADLGEALRRKVRSPLEAAADPDFAPALGHPAFAALLPSAPLQADAVAPEGSVFVGSDLNVEVRVAALPDADLALQHVGVDPGCVRLVRVVQDDHAEPGATLRRVTLVFRAEGPCSSRLGPFRVAAGATGVEVAAVPVVVEAPPGTPPAKVPPLPATLPLPGALAPKDASAAFVRVGDGVAWMGRPDRLPTGNDRRPDVALEWRVDGQTRAAGGWWREAGPVTLKGDDGEVTVP